VPQGGNNLNKDFKEEKKKTMNEWVSEMEGCRSGGTVNGGGGIVGWKGEREGA